MPFGGPFDIYYRDVFVPAIEAAGLISVRGDEITIRDLRSRNRTFVDDRQIDPEVEVEVSPGVRLRFGSVEARLTKV